MSFILNRSTAIATSPPPGVRLPWWDRSRPRRAAGHAGRGLQVVLHNPRYAFLAALGLLAAVGYGSLGALAPAAALALAAAGFVMWVVFRPTEVRQALWGWWRSNRRYRWRWGRTMRRCDAAKMDVPLPLLISTRSTAYVDKLRVHVPTGLDPSAFQDYRADLLKWGWRGISTRVFNPEPKHQTVELWNLIKDPLIDVVPPMPRPVELLPREGYQMARIEDGEPWSLKIKGGPANTFVCGVTGSGKGSFIGSLLDQLHADIEAGTVEMWGIDPQASELGMWRHLFKKLVYSQAEAAVMLEELIAVMDRRTRSMFGIARQHQPRVGDPIYVLVVDEGLDLLDKTDRVLYRRITIALSALLRKDRKASIAVVFLAQRAELEFVEFRKLFSWFVALKQATEMDVDLVLGRGALAAGARPHEFDLPGLVYVASDHGIMRGRLPYYSDDYIRDLGPAPGNEKPENLPPPPGDGDKFGGILIG